MTFQVSGRPNEHSSSLSYLFISPNQHTHAESFTISSEKLNCYFRWRLTATVRKLRSFRKFFGEFIIFRFEKTKSICGQIHLAADSDKHLHRTTPNHWHQRKSIRSELRPHFSNNRFAVLFDEINVCGCAVCRLSSQKEKWFRCAISSSTVPQEREPIQIHSPKETTNDNSMGYDYEFFWSNFFFLLGRVNLMEIESQSKRREKIENVDSPLASRSSLPSLTLFFPQKSEFSVDIWFSSLLVVAHTRTHKVCGVYM